MRRLVSLLAFAACGSPSSPPGPAATIPAATLPARVTPAPVTPAPVTPPVVVDARGAAVAPPLGPEPTTVADAYLPYALGDYAGPSGALHVGSIERITLGTLFATDGTVRIFVVTTGPDGHSLTTYRIVPAAMKSSTLFETFGVREKGTTAKLERKAGPWSLARAGNAIRIEDRTHAIRLVTNKLEAIAPAPAPALMAQDREFAAAVATGGFDAWLAASVPDGGAFHWISGLAVGTEAVREDLDGAKHELGPRTPRMARLAPSGKLGVTLGALASVDSPETTFAYLTLWQLAPDGRWQVLFSTIQMPQ